MQQRVQQRAADLAACTGPPSYLKIGGCLGRDVAAHHLNNPLRLPAARVHHAAARAKGV